MPADIDANAADWPIQLRLTGGVYDVFVNLLAIRAASVACSRRNGWYV